MCQLDSRRRRQPLVYFGMSKDSSANVAGGAFREPRGYRMIVIYTNALYDDPGATLDDLREAVTTLEEAARTSRRVLGGNHPITLTVENSLRESRAALRAGETPSTR